MRVLFVCMGNICRSPLAEGAFRARLSGQHLDLPVIVDSAGTHGYHAGSPPDLRAQAAAQRRGFDISGQRARQVTAADLERFDLVLVMDEDNLVALNQLQPADAVRKPRLLLDFAGPTLAGRNVPDPYYGGASGFERVLDLVDQALDGLVDEVLRQAAARNRTTD